MHPRNFWYSQSHVGGCEMARLLAWSSRHVISVFDLVLGIHVMVNWQLSEKGIHWPVSHDCIFKVMFLKLSADQFLVLNWSGAQVHFLRWYSVCSLLAAKFKLLKNVPREPCTGCPKSSFLPVVSLYFSTIGLGKEIISIKVVSFNIIHYFHTCCAIFCVEYSICVLPRQSCACASIFSRHIFFVFRSPNCSNSFLVFCEYHER